MWDNSKILIRSQINSAISIYMLIFVTGDLINEVKANLKSGETRQGSEEDRR